MVSLQSWSFRPPNNPPLPKGREKKTTWMLFMEKDGCFQKKGYLKMDGENNGKPY